MLGLNHHHCTNIVMFDFLYVQVTSWERVFIYYIQMN